MVMSQRKAALVVDGRCDGRKVAEETFSARFLTDARRELPRRLTIGANNNSENKDRPCHVRHLVPFLPVSGQNE